MKRWLWRRSPDTRVGGFQIVCAALATFVALGGIGMALHGAVSDRRGTLLLGCAALVGGIVTLVVTLNIPSNDRA